MKKQTVVGMHNLFHNIRVKDEAKWYHTTHTQIYLEIRRMLFWHLFKEMK